MNPTKPTPSLLDRIKSSLDDLRQTPDNYYASLALLRDIVSYLDRLEKDTPCSDSAASTAPSPSASPSEPSSASPSSSGSCATTCTTPDTPPTPAGEGRVPVPEWCEQITRNDVGSHIGGCDCPYCGVVALRADRDRWREKAERHNNEIALLIKNYDDLSILQAARIAELEAAQARQMVTIETLTAQLNEASKACEMWMTLAQPARKYPTVEQVNQWHGQWYRGFSAKVFSDWLRDRAREQEGKAP
jgi:hypothetical protein